MGAKDQSIVTPFDGWKFAITMNGDGMLCSYAGHIPRHRVAYCFIDGVDLLLCL